MTPTPSANLGRGHLSLIRTMGYTTALGYTPTFSISKDGDDIASSIANRVTSIRVESREGGGEADICDITLDDRDWCIISPSIGEGSATLSLAMGYAQTGLHPMGTFRIDELYYEWTPKQIRLHGNSLGMTTAAKAPIVQSFDNQTLGDIIGNIASAAGVSPKVDPDLAAIKIPFLNQTCSPMHLLQELERRYNGLGKFNDGYLSFTKRGSGDSASGSSIGGFVLGPDDFGPNGCSIQVTNRFAYSQVKAGWFDPTTYTTKWVTSVTRGNPNSNVPYTVRTIHPSQAEAQAVADSTMSQLNRRSKQGTLILAKGHPAIRGGQGFAIAGCRDGIDGTSYLVRRAVHTLTKDAGLMTTIDCYDEGDGADFSGQSTDGGMSFTGIPVTTLPAAGIGHM